MVRISAVISAYNEEKKITGCLASVEWVDEIILVDNSSVDKTVEIAKKYNAKIYNRPNNPMLNINKNFGFSKATGDWILNLDADERVTKELAEEIKDTIKKEEVSVVGYWIPRKNIIFGKWIQNSIWWPDPHLRLFKKGMGKFPEVHVHEHIVISGETKELKHPLIHENYSSISQFLHKMDTIYTENEVENFLKSGKTIHYLDALRFPLRDFLKTFFYQKGYKDGLHGLVLSILQAFYSFIVFAKVWERKGFEEENPNNFVHDLYAECKKLGYEFKYWFLSIRMEESKSTTKKFIYRVLRKIAKQNI